MGTNLARKIHRPCLHPNHLPIPACFGVHAKGRGLGQASYGTCTLIAALKERKGNPVSPQCNLTFGRLSLTASCSKSLFPAEDRGCVTAADAAMIGVKAQDTKKEHKKVVQAFG